MLIQIARGMNGRVSDVEDMAVRQRPSMNVEAVLFEHIPTFPGQKLEDYIEAEDDPLAKVICDIAMNAEIVESLTRIFPDLEKVSR